MINGGTAATAAGVGRDIVDVALATGVGRKSVDKVVAGLRYRVLRCAIAGAGLRYRELRCDISGGSLDDCGWNIHMDGDTGISCYAICVFTGTRFSRLFRAVLLALTFRTFSWFLISIP